MLLPSVTSLALLVCILVYNTAVLACHALFTVTIAALAAVMLALVAVNCGVVATPDNAIPLPLKYAAVTLPVAVSIDPLILPMNHGAVILPDVAKLVKFVILAPDMFN